MNNFVKKLGLKSGRWKQIVLSVKEPEKVKALIEGRLEPNGSEMVLAGLAQTART